MAQTCMFFKEAIDKTSMNESETVYKNTVASKYSQLYLGNIGR